MAESRTTQHFLKGQAIVAEGSVGDRTFKILHGEVLVCRENRENQMVPITRLGPGELFGEMYLFDNDNRRNATVVAASSEVVVEIYFKDEMETLLGSLNPAVGWVISGFQNRLNSTTGTCADLSQGIVMSKLPDGQLKTSERSGGITLRQNNPLRGPI